MLLQWVNTEAKGALEQNFERGDDTERSLQLNQSQQCKLLKSSKLIKLDVVFFINYLNNANKLFITF